MANVRLKDAVLGRRGSRLEYVKAVLGALHEVDDALVAHDAEQTRYASLGATVDAAALAAS